MIDPDKTQSFSLGVILEKMNAASREQIADGLEAQKGEPDVRLGEILVRVGVLTQAQLDVALQAQEELRSSKRHVRALAAARLAETSNRSVSTLAKAVKETAQKVRRESSDSYERITDKMLEEAKRNQ